MARVVTIRRLPKQREFFECPDKWAAARGGVGSGKTTAVVWWAFRRLTSYPKHAAFVIGADYEQLRRGYFQSFVGFLEQRLGWENGKEFRYRENPTPMVTFRNGARLRALSAETAQRIRSVEIQTAILEEPQTWQAGEAVYGVLLGRVRHSERTAELYGESLQPQGRMTFNPPAVGTWLYDLIERQWPLVGYKCWRFSLRENTLLEGREEYIRDLEMTYSPEKAAVEIDGHWATVGGDVYRGFDFAIHTKAPEGFPPLAIDERKPLLWSLDFNVGWMASSVLQAHVQELYTAGFERPPGKLPTPITRKANPAWQRRVFYVLDELFLNDAGTPDVVDEFVSRHGALARKVGVVVYGDASGIGRSQMLSATASARSNWEIVMGGLRRAGIPFEMKVPTVNPAVMDRINAVRAQFRTADGYGLVVDPVKCPELIRDFQGVRFKPGTNEIDKSDKSESGLKRTHLSDEIGYLIWVERRLERREAIELRDFMQR